MKFHLALLLSTSLAFGADETFYKRPALFSTRPSETNSLNPIARFGPVGMGIDLIQPAFTMRVGKIEEGSPAAATGKLKTGQIITSINGQTLKEIDPRIQLGQILGVAEAGDGILKFAIQGESEPVVVKVPVMGAYSATWPLNCPKSDKIVRDFADYLAKPGADEGRFGLGMLFLLSTGEDKDLEPVRKWAHGLGSATMAWELGYAGLPLCEYYLRTGDQEILPKIQQWADNAVKGQYLDAWAGRGGVPAVTYGMGHLNAAGTGVATFLLLAKECGAEIPDQALLGALTHFYRYAGRGGNPYGDGRPEMGFVDNGKNGLLAFTMAAAASLTPDGENSVYAAARDSCAMTSFYTTTFMLHGHTGGGIGEIWRSAAMGLLREKRPNQYREFMDNRQWHYDLSRRFDGSFGILGGAGYDSVDWGAGYSLAYTVPRKTLRITGATPTKFSKTYQLPKQPWGTAADNEFLSLDAVPDASGKKQDLSGETIAKDSSMPFFRHIHGSKTISDDEIRRHIHHQDHNIRFVAANKALGIDSAYIAWRTPGGKVRPELVMEFLHSKSPLVRRAMFSAIFEILKREKKTDVLTREIFDLAVAAVKDPEEAWTIKDDALQIIGQAAPDWVVPHVDLILPFLKHDEWYLRNAALSALAPAVADERSYQKVLPAIGELIRTNQRSALTLGMKDELLVRIKEGSPAVKALAAETLKETYTGYAGVKTAPGGQDITSTLDSHLQYIAASLADVPGGLDMLYDVARDRYPNQILPYKEFFLKADPKQFGPKLKAAITPILTNELIPEYVGKNRVKLHKLAAVEEQSSRPGGPNDVVDGLAGLYDRAGEEGYDWHMFLDLNEAEWTYHTFDPIPTEQVPWDQLISRYRKVTPPQGMENWYATDFDPAKAGWRTGKSPFANYDDKIPVGPVSKCSAACVGPDCYGATKVNTLWEKEVLLLHGTFKVPPLKDGHRYRLRVNHSAHVGNGGGYIVYINGKPLIEQTDGIGRGGGEQPNGAFITKEWLDPFKAGEITIAVESFLRYNDKYSTKPTTRVPQGRISVHLDEQKLPPMGDDLVVKSATVVPMLSSGWQAAQFSESDEERENAPLFRWDGKFVPNPEIFGSWKVVAEVPEIDGFNPSKKAGFRKPVFAQMTLMDGGSTADPYWVWSGDHLMDLTNYQALRMQAKTVEGAPYLFVESGGFSTRQKPGWKSSWLVLGKQ